MALAIKTLSKPNSINLLLFCVFACHYLDMKITLTVLTMNGNMTVKILSILFICGQDPAHKGTPTHLQLFGGGVEGVSFLENLLFGQT